jgi:hypothetical protein
MMFISGTALELVEIISLRPLYTKCSKVVLRPQNTVFEGPCILFGGSSDIAGRQWSSCGHIIECCA